MKNILDHYYLFSQKTSAKNKLMLLSKHGYYAHFEENENVAKELVVTYSQQINFEISDGLDYKICNPFTKDSVGIAHFNNYQDTIVVINKPLIQSVEFFISQNCKEFSLVIYHLLKTNDLEDQFKELRKKARPVTHYSNILL